MILMPSRFSLVARLTASVSHCTFMNLGMASHSETAMTSTSASNAQTTTMVHSMELP